MIYQIGRKRDNDDPVYIYSQAKNLLFDASEYSCSLRGCIYAFIVHKKVQEIAPGSARTRIMRSSMKLPEAKTWANCSPSTGYATYIPHHYFKV